MEMSSLFFYGLPLLFLALTLLRKLLGGRRVKICKGRTWVLVTGAANGLGREICRVFAVSPVYELIGIVALDIDLVALEKLADEFKDVKNVKILIYHVDLGSIHELEQTCEKIKYDLGNEFVEILINNAGIRAGFVKTENVGVQEFAQTLNVNCVSNLTLIQAFLPEMRKRNVGTIVGINSVMSQLSAVGLVDYCVSKSAQFCLYDCLRLELWAQSENINVLQICPFVLDTRLFEKVFDITKASSFVDKLRNFIFPPLRAVYVANRILTAVQEREQVVFIYPSLKYPIFVLKLFPVPMQLQILNLMGGTKLGKRVEEHLSRQKTDELLHSTRF